MAAESTSIVSEPRLVSNENETYNREEEYAMAQRAAVEATMVGRETLEVALRQGEQLQKAENLADETEYKLDRATRVLRGMTWAGWWANKLSRDVEPPEYKSHKAAIDAPPPKVYEDVPSGCASAAQAIQNYHANVQVFEESCETMEQKQILKTICDEMYQKAKREVTSLLRRQELESLNMKSFPTRLAKDLKTLRERQDIAEDSITSQEANPQLRDANGSATRSALFSCRTETDIDQNPVNEMEHQQNSHLDFMSKHLDELGSLASNLSSSLALQSDTLDCLDEKSDSMLFKSRMVTRRTDQAIQKKSWSRPKSEFLHHAYIRHVASGRYVAVSTSNAGLILSDKLNETCIFGLWQRQTSSKVFGLQSKYSKRWCGQNLLGNLVCSAFKFDRREEWDADESDWSHTTILCASAGWGNGGYLMIRKEDGSLTIGGGGLKDKRDADVWCIEEYDQGGTRTKENPS